MKATEQCFPVVLFLMLYVQDSLTFDFQWMKSLIVNIHVKAVERYSPVELFVMLYKVVLTFESVDQILKCDHSNESYWAMLSCGVVSYVGQDSFNFWFPVNEILNCDHSRESCCAVLSCDAVYYAGQSSSNFWVRGPNPKVWPFKWKLLSRTFLWCCLLCCTRWF